jgi:hypothetical protein
MTDKRWTCDPGIDAFLARMTLPDPEYMQQLAAERGRLEAAAPKPGEAAHDFSVERLLSGGGRSGESVCLKDFSGGHLALLFGSYTCPVFRGQTERFNQIYSELNSKLEFLLVYISEAHPEDGWQIDINRTQDVVYTQPVSLNDRAAIARDCITKRNIQMPTALDDIDNTMGERYSGSPERLYLIDNDSLVQHRSIPGPFNMQTIEEWYQSLLSV